tara:strand:+ start:1450 stop:2223 length:774 start_codon:yes stop_codon:yes gene_type:complete
MIKKRILAGVIVKDNQVVQSIGYRNYLPIGKPEIVVGNLDRWQADEILINVIDRSNSNKGPDLEILKKINEINIQTPLIYGGGISKLEDAIKVIKLGADRIVLESIVEENYMELVKISQIIGSQSIVISMPLSINKNKILFYDYKKKKEIEISNFFLNAIKNKLFSELLIVDYKNQGFMNGFNIEILKKFTYDVPIILYGGISGKKNTETILADKRVSALTFGNSLNYSEHSIQKIKNFNKKNFFREPYFQKDIKNA